MLAGTVPGTSLQGDALLICFLGEVKAGTEAELKGEEQRVPTQHRRTELWGRRAPDIKDALFGHKSAYSEKGRGLGSRRTETKR